MTAYVDRQAALARARGQGRHIPATRRQAEQAEAGAAACDADFPAGNIRYGDALIGTDRFWRAAYEMRYHQILAAVGCPSLGADLPLACGCQPGAHAGTLDAVLQCAAGSEKP
jgi:hypothetical protein